MKTRTLLVSVLLVGCECGGGPGPELDVGPVDAAGLDAPGTDAPRPPMDAPFVLSDVGPRPDAGPPGDLSAEITATPEVARIPAAGAPASDSEVVLDAIVSSGVTSIHWQVFES